jgi:hypothetical protein
MVVDLAKAKAKRQFIPDPSEKGVLQFLSKIPRFSVESSLIALGASTVRTGKGTNENIANILELSTTWWCSENVPGQWLLIGFPRHYLQLSMIQFHCQNLHFPKKWALKGRKADSGEWTILRQFGEDPRYGQSHAKVLQIVEVEQPYRFFKIEALSESWSGDHFFLLNYVEFFGTLYEID